MKRIRISITLPYALRLQNGEYSVFVGDDNPLRLSRIAAPTTVSGVRAAFTGVTHEFEASDTLSREETEKKRTDEANRLLRSVNRLLRWYRSVTQEPEIVELSRAQAGFFEFTDQVSGQTWGGPALVYEPASTIGVCELTDSEVEEGVRAGLASGDQPDLAQLLLLDAERALREGRYREAVLLCWACIDNAFGQHYNSSLEEKLKSDAQEYRDAMKAGAGSGLSMKTRMTVGLRLVTGRSLAEELGDDGWQLLTESYSKRNAVIHRGASATKPDGRKALSVAHSVLAALDLISRIGIMPGVDHATQSSSRP